MQKCYLKITTNILRYQTRHLKYNFPIKLEVNSDLIFESNTISLAKVMDGQDGQGQYIHIMWSDVESPQSPGDMSQFPSDYMGVCVDTNPTPPQDPSLYTWQKVKGEDGKQGATGRPGVAGQDGATYYTHIKWSNDGGNTFSEGTGAWLGIMVDSSPDAIEIPMLYQWTRVAGTDGTTMQLSNESHTIPVDENGLNGDYTGAETVVSIFEGKEETTSSWEIVIAESDGVTGHFENNTYILTEIIAESGYVDFTATKLGYSPISKRFQIATSKSGKTGENAVTKWLMIEPTVIHKDVNGNISPEEIIITGKQQSGEEPVEGCNCKFRVTVDGGIIYESENLESSKVISISDTAQKIQIEMISEDNQVIDSQSVAVVSDGQHGTNGKTYVLNLKSETSTIIYDYNGKNPMPQTISPFSAELYENGVLITSGITYEWTSKSMNSVLSGTSTSATFTPILSSSYNPDTQYENAVVLIAEYDGQTLYASQPLVIQKSAKPGTNAITGVLTNESHTIPTDYNGNNGNYQGATTTLFIYEGTMDVSDAWSVTAKASNGVTGSLSGKTYTVTGITVDSGYVDFIATRSGYSNIEKRFQLSRVKFGEPGKDGEDGKDGAPGKDGTDGTPGADSVAYWMICDSSVIYKNVDGTLSPTSITLTGKCQQGLNAVANYACRFKIYADNASVYTSSVDETLKSYTIPSGKKNIKVEMYKAGGTTTLLDQQTIPVLADGAPGKDGQDGIDGEDGVDGYTVIITNENESFPCDSVGNIVSNILTTTKAIVYKGTDEIDATIGTLPTIPGLSLSAVQNVVSITVQAGTNLTDKGSFDIPIIADGKTFTRTFSWTKLYDMSGDLDEIKTTITEVESTVDKINGEIKNFVSVTVFNQQMQAVDTKFSQVNQTVDGITSEVSSVKTDFQNQLDAHSTKITQTADKLSLIATGDSQSGITLTENFISLVSDGTIGIAAEEFNIDGLTTFMNSVTPKNDKTIIDGGKILTNSVTADKLITGILKSKNYKDPTGSDVFAQAGTFYDLEDGSITSKNFSITDDGSVYVRGTVYATAGSFSGTVYATDGEFKGSIKAGSTITGATITGSTINTTSGKFTVDNDGILHATNAVIQGTITAKNSTFSGTVTATAGSIGGFSIQNGTLQGGSVTLDPNSISCGDYFSVDSEGRLNAVNAYISGNGSFSGTITASSGTIGGFTITDNSLYNGSDQLGGSGVYVSPEGISCNDTFVVDESNKTGSLAGFTFTNSGQIQNNSHAYANTLYRIVNGSDGYDYQAGIKAASATNGETEAAFYVRKKLRSQNWGQSTLPFYVRNNGYVYAEDLTVGNTLYMMGSVLVDDDEYNYVNTRFKVLSGSANSVDVGMLNNSSGGWFSSYGDSGSTYDIYYSLSGTSGALYCPYTFEYNNIDSSDGKARFSFHPSSTNVKSNIGSPNMYFQNGYLTTLYVNTINLNGDPITEWPKGGGGTTNYVDLTNKPKIENNTLNAGNNTAASLGLATAGHNHAGQQLGISDNPITSAYINNGYFQTQIGLAGDKISSWTGLIDKISWDIPSSSTYNSGHIHRGIGNIENYGIWINGGTMIYPTMNASSGALPGTGHTGYNNAFMDFGSDTYPFKTLYVKEISLNGSKRTSWPSGGGITNATASAKKGDNAVATVTVSGNTANFSFTLPKGDTGPQGPQGQRGATGPQGPQGQRGATGPQGPAGQDGVDSDQIRSGEWGILASSSRNIYPARNGSRSNGAVSLGGSGYYYNIVFYKSLSQESDRNVKNTITKISNDKNLEQFYMKLNPVSYYLNDDDEHNKRFGFIAQDVENNLIQNNIYSDKYALVTSYPNLDNEKNSSKSKYSICYTEFIALNTSMTQKAHHRIDDLEQQNSQLQSQNQQLTNQLLTLQGELAILKQQMQEIKEAMKNA